MHYFRAMQNRKIKYYPTTIEAIHLLVLYVFLQSVVDFPLALYDYNHDTNWISNQWIGLISSFSITAFIYIYGFKKSKSTIKQVFAIKTFNPLILLPVMVLLPALQYLVGILNIKVDEILPPPPWFWELFEKIFENRFGFWGALMKVVILAPIIEEVLFRGIIMHGLMKNYRSWYAVLLSGVLFSVFHLNPWQMTYTFFLGLLLGWIMVRTKSLPLAILVHAINNLIVLLSITYNEQIQQHYLMNLSHNVNVKIAFSALGIGLILIFLITFKPKKAEKKTENILKNEHNIDQT